MAKATTPTDEVQVEAARARWRADLLNLDAAERRRIAGKDNSPIAQEIGAAAESKDVEATIHLDHAEAIERHSIAKQERYANPQDEQAIAKSRQAAQDLVDLRQYWRYIGEMSGTRRGVMTVDNFPEPTDEEVLATHGGTN